MKRTLLACLLALSPLCVLGQGTVNFSNATSVYGTNTPDHLLRWHPGAAIYYPALTAGGLVSSNYGGVDLTGLRAQLFYGASTITHPGSLTAVIDAPATFRASTSANAGSWLGGFRTLLGFNPGDTVSLNVIVWDVRFVADPMVAFALQGGGGLFGISGVFNYTIPAAGSPPTAYLPSGQIPFVIPQIPEPASLALAGLGAVTLLLWRRTKSTGEEPKKLTHESIGKT
jgi:hypothetical protein